MPKGLLGLENSGEPTAYFEEQGQGFCGGPQDAFCPYCRDSENDHKILEASV